MEDTIYLFDADLTLFDGASGGAGAGASGSAPSAAGDAQGGTAGEGKMGEGLASRGNTRRGKQSGEGQTVLFGKQSAVDAASTSEQGQAAADAGQAEEADATEASRTLEDKRKAFRDIINGEYKDIYTEETQRIIDRRFRETKQLEQQTAQQQPIIELLMQRYQISDGDISKLMSAVENDDVYWSEAAEEAGMDVNQFKQFNKLQRENEAFRREKERQRNRQAAQQQLQTWYADGEQVKQVYPEFDLSKEARNPQFLSMLKTGIPVQHAYEVIHMDDIKAGIAKGAAQETEQQVVANIRAKGQRPAENGTSSQSAFTVKDDPSKWSRAERAEVARRVARGEQIAL